MKDNPSVAIYKELADITTLMLAHAENGQWQKLLALGDQYQLKCELLQKQATNPEQAEQQRDLIAKILAKELKIRTLIQPELDKLSESISLGKNRRNAITAYYDTVKTDLN